MIKSIASAISLTVFLGGSALAQYAQVTKYVKDHPDEGKITFVVMMDGLGTYPEYNESCFTLLTDPGGRTYHSGGTGVNFAICRQDAFYEYYQEDGTFEVEVTAYAVPFEGYPPFNPYYYDNKTKIQAQIQPWLKLDPGGWNPAQIAANSGVAHLGARITTSRSCAGSVTLDAAFAFPSGLQTVSSPLATLTAQVNPLAINNLNFGTLSLKSDNSVAGSATASVQLVSHPAQCTLQKDPMFSSALTINGAN